MMRRLPQAVAMTIAVIGAPLLIVTFLVSSFGAPGSAGSIIAMVGMATILSMAVSYAGAALWSHRLGSGDVMFADLTLWGWVASWRRERQLASATRLLKRQQEPAEDLPFRLNATERVDLLERLSGILEARRPDTHGHSRRVARHVTAIAEQMGLPAEEVARIRTAAAVHDVGKIYVVDKILDKPGKLTFTEFNAVKEHSTFGAEMVAALGDPELARIVRHHHERLDGRGYPDGLSGEQIPLGSRIIAVADTFDAVTSSRPYREAKSHKEALELLRAEAGTQLDPDAVRAFRRYYSGHRRVGALALLLSGPRELILTLAGGLKLGGVVLATSLAAVGAGGVALNTVDSTRQPPKPIASAQSTATPVSSSPAPSSSPAEGSPSKQGAKQDAAKGDAKSPEAGPNAGIAIPDQEAPPSTDSGGDESAPAESPSPSTAGADTGSSPAGESSESATSTVTSTITSTTGGGQSSLHANPKSAVPHSVTLPETSKATAPVTSTVGSVVKTPKSIPVPPVTTPEVTPAVPKVTVGQGGK
jgi:putative nucleotidyltransferase with HDIG domain